MKSISKKTFLTLTLAIFTVTPIVIYIAYNFSQKNYFHAAAKNEDKLVNEKIIVEGNQYITAFHHAKPEKGLVIYISDASSPNTTQDYAKKIAGLSYLVANINAASLLTLPSTNNEHCVNIAEQLINITQQLQKKYSISEDILPILVGNAEGAVLVYAALAQAKKNSFHAGISINFQPSLDTMTDTAMPLCAVNNFTSTPTTPIRFLPAKHVSANWYIFQHHEITKNTANNDFFAKNTSAKLTLADSAEVDPLTGAIQILQWLDPRLADQISSNNSDSDLPLIEVEENSNPHIKLPMNQQTTMAVLLTGDGGWAEIDKHIAKILAEKGIPTVAVDSLSYFWRARTPEETANDIDHVIHQYRNKWQKEKVLLIGYSFGADVLPFIANKLTETHKKNIALVALLGISKTAAFEFRLSSWMNADKSETRLPLMPELTKLKWANSICIYGVKDKETICPKTASVGVKVISMAGDHHFDEKYDLLVQHIIENIQ